MSATSITSPNSAAKSTIDIGGVPPRRVWSCDVSVGIYLAFWLTLLIGGQSRFFQDPGTFWHTVVGNHILQSGQLVTHDSFTYTRNGEPWIAQQWLGEVSLAALDRLGGRDAQLIAATAILAAFYAWITMRLRRAGFDTLIAVLCVTLIIAASGVHFHVRPHLATIVGMGITIALLCDVDSGKVPIRQLSWLVPLVIVWTNIHGGVVAGLASIVLVLSGWLLFSFTKLPTPVRTNQERLWIVAVGVCCLLSTLCNPYGWQLPATWLRIVSLSLPNIIEEHAPLNWHELVAWLTALWFVVYAFALTGLLRRPTKQDTTPWYSIERYFVCLPRVTWLLPIVWFYLAVGRVRNVPLFVVIAGISLAEILPATRWRPWLINRGWIVASGRDRKASMGERLKNLATAATATAIVSVTVISLGWAKLNQNQWPVDLLPELAKLSQDSKSKTPIFNSMRDGGFLEYYCPQLMVFIDDRCELFGDELLQSYANAERNHPEQISDWQKKYQFEAAIVRNDTPFERFLSNDPEWSLVRRGACASLYRRSKVAQAVAQWTTMFDRSECSNQLVATLVLVAVNRSESLKIFASPRFDIGAH